MRATSGLSLIGRVEITIILFLVASTVSLSAQTFTSLLSFDVANGAYPYGAAVVQGLDGNLYGTTSIGGTNNCTHAGCGVFYQYNPTTQQEKVLYSFCALANCADGSNPQGGVVLGTDGNFYGTTVAGGANTTCSGGCGTIFQMTPAGVLTTLYSFSGGADGSDPQGPLLQASNGNFYATTSRGGGTSNAGTVFAINPKTRVLTTLHSFSGSDGANPFSGVIQATNGNLYGTTSSGGTFWGTVFQMTLAGKLTTLHVFNGSDGGFPNGLLQATDGNLYGTTLVGGNNTDCNFSSCGTIYKMTLTGVLSTLYSFTDGADGAQPSAGLIQATDNKFYGTASQGGNVLPNCSSLGCGTIFSFSGSTLTPLHSFVFTDGSSPAENLYQATSGILYGLTGAGGNSGNQCDCGTLFSLSMPGLGSFVQALPYSGKVGATINFLGQGFTSSSTVSFNGKSSTPTVISGTNLTAKVPNGATTGPVTITTVTGSLKSNQKFRVIPQIKTFSPPSGPVGTVVTITGVSLIQTTRVTFGGVKATVVTINSDTQVTATVPTGAKTGHIVITTPGGTATSAGTFAVT